MAGCLFRLQRYSAIALVPFVIGHLVTILAVGAAGLTAEQVLTRTDGSLAWSGFYGVFVLLIAVHGSIGLWRVGKLLGVVSSRLTAGLAVLFGVLTMALGIRAILGLFGVMPSG